MFASVDLTVVVLQLWYVVQAPGEVILFLWSYLVTLMPVVVHFPIAFKIES